MQCILLSSYILLSLSSDHNGPSSLRKIEVIKEEGQAQEQEDKGAFANPAAKEVLKKAKELQR